MNRTAILTILALAVALVAHAQDKPLSLVRNGGFERAGGWTMSPPVDIMVSDRGGKCLRSTGGGATQDVFVGPTGKTYTVAADMKVDNVKADPRGGYAFVAVYQLDEHGQYQAFHDFGQLTGTGDWKRFSYTFQLDPRCVTISLRCGLFQAAGTAYWDNWTLVEGDRAMDIDQVTESGRQARTGGGAAAIFRQDGFPVEGTASSPTTLATALQAANLKTAFLSAADLANPSVLRVEDFDILVLPYGASFPAAARDNVIHFLHDGGNFISMGGYVFNNLVLQDGDAWKPEKQVLTERLQAALAKDKSLIPDGSFEGGEEPIVGGSSLDGKWHVWSKDYVSIVTEDHTDGAKCAKVSIPVNGPSGDAGFYLDLPPQTGKMYRVSGWAKTQNVSGDCFAYLALYQYGDNDKLIKFVDYAQLRGTNDWKQYSYDFVPGPDVKRIYVKFGLYRAVGTAWFDDFRLADIDGSLPRPMNTSTGGPGDGLDLAAYQIGTFDADFRLKRTASLATAEGQHIFPAGIKMTTGFDGWAAHGKQGYDEARWVPLLEGYDKYGRPRGSAGSLMINYNGYYAGSMWGYFGVENTDLFASSSKAILAGLGELARFMSRGMFLRNLATDLYTYEPGETAKLSVVADNRGLKPQAGAVRFEVFSGNAAKPTFTRDCPCSCQGEDVQTVTAEFRLPADFGDLARVRATMLLQGKPVDEVARGFVVKSKAVVASGVEMLWRDNYFTIGGRPMFLFGSDTYANSYDSATENPWTWSQDHLAARDMGLNVYENLGSGWADYKPRESDWRKFEGMAQLTQKYGLQFMPGMLIGQNVAIGEAQVAAESELCREYAKHLGDVPGLVWYINGDYQLNYDDKDALKLRWNAFLTAKYGTTDKLREAWGAANVPAELGALPFPPANSGKWDDRREIDRHLFNVWLMTTWNESHVKALHSQDPVHAITSEYYQRPFNGIDLLATIDGQDVSNIGFFDQPKTDLEILPWMIRWNDLRARGKGVCLGEYGVKTHPGWSLENHASGYHIQRTEEQQKQLFMAVAHYGLGMGVAKVQNWSLRDASENVFPWGYFYPNQLIPKDVAYVHRNQSLIWRHFRPKYVAPPLTVLISDNMRMGNGEGAGPQAVYQTFATLLSLHQDFNSLNDGAIRSLSTRTKTLVYPMPMCPSDAAYQGVLDFVKRGGTLILTGDISYDENRQRTRTERLNELCGVEFVAERYANTDRPLDPGKAKPCIEVKPAGATVVQKTPEGLPLLTRFAVGQGTVYYCTDGFAHADKADLPILRDTYAQTLQAAGAKPLAIAPDDPDVHVFAQPTERGVVHVLYNTTDAPGAKELALPTAGVTLRVRNGWPGLAAVTNDGKLIAATCDGRIVSDKPVLDGTGLIGALSLDGETLAKSSAVVLTPFEMGEARLMSTRQWKERVVLIGELCDGQWRTYERLPGSPGAVSVKLNADRASCIIVVCEKADEAKWTQYLGEAFTHPEKVGGM